MTDAERLRQAGQLLHGRWFHSALAFDLGVARKTVQRWDGEESPVPSTIWPEIRALLRKHGREALACADLLPV